MHLVFVAKYRRKVFTKEILDDMQVIFEEVCSKFEAQLVEFDGECHVHLLVVYPPKVAISSLVNSLKGVSSRLLQKEYPSLKEQLWGCVMVAQLFAGSCGGEQLKLYASTLNSKIHRTKYHLCSFIHRPKSVFTATEDKDKKTLG